MRIRARKRLDPRPRRQPEAQESSLRPGFARTRLRTARVGSVLLQLGSRSGPPFVARKQTEGRRPTTGDDNARVLSEPSTGGEARLSRFAAWLLDVTTANAAGAVYGAMMVGVL